MKVTNYGSVLVICEVPAHERPSNFGEITLNGLKRLLDKPQYWKQHARIARDIQMLEGYMEKFQAGANLALYWRQYAGHKYIPNKVNNKYPILAIGSYVSWQ